MGEDVALAFLNAVNQNAALKDQLRAEKLQENLTPERQQRLLHIAAAAGYTFTIEELMAAARTVTAKRVASGELSEEDLELIAGGQANRLTGTCFYSR